MRDHRRNRWRFEADPAVEHFLATANRENRSISNTILVLLKEAIAARRAADQHVVALAGAIKTMVEVLRMFDRDLDHLLTPAPAPARRQRQRKVAGHPAALPPVAADRRYGFIHWDGPIEGIVDGDVYVGMAELKRAAGVDKATAFLGRAASKKPGSIVARRRCSARQHEASARSMPNHIPDRSGPQGP